MKAASSIKGAACSNTAPCKVGFSDLHNERKSKASDITCNPNTTIRPELSVNNTVWKAPDVPSLYSLDSAIRRDYAATERFKKIPETDKEGKPMRDAEGHIIYKKDEDGNFILKSYYKDMPSKGKTAASPLKETLLLLPSNEKETDAMVDEFVKRVETLTGWRCVRKFVHRDERYDDPDTGESHFNRHAHIVWDAYDYQAHTVNGHGKPMMRKMNDIAAEVTGMPRGRDARETRANHLTVLEQKTQAERGRIRTIQKENLLFLRAMGTDIVQYFDQIRKIATPCEYDIQRRDTLSEDVANRAAQAATLQEHIRECLQSVKIMTDRMLKEAKAAKKSRTLALSGNKILSLFLNKDALREVEDIKAARASEEKAWEKVTEVLKALKAEHARAEELQDCINKMDGNRNEEAEKAWDDVVAKVKIIESLKKENLRLLTKLNNYTLRQQEQEQQQSQNRSQGIHI